MEVAVNLHTHERIGSFDSRTPAWRMCEAYRERVSPWSLVGFVGHDSRPPDQTTPTLSITGTERSVSYNGRIAHVIEYPDYDFSFLAHPGMTFEGNVVTQALEAVTELGLDGVERWNGGNVQYHERVPYPELAGDDAHSELGVGRSYMVVDVDTVSAAAVMEEVKRGRFDVVNRPSYGRSVFHSVEKALVVVAERLTPGGGNKKHGRTHPQFW